VRTSSRRRTTVVENRKKCLELNGPPVTSVSDAKSVMTPARSWARLSGANVLRGLAILFVLMIHVNMPPLIAEVAHTKGLPDQLVSSAPLGVDERR